MLNRKYKGKEVLLIAQAERAMAETEKAIKAIKNMMNEKEVCKFRDQLAQLKIEW